MNNLDTEPEVECCICYEQIGSVNNCTTECGHKFCFKCMAKSLQTYHTCPYCRAVIIEPKTTYDQLNEIDHIFEDSDDELYLDDEPSQSSKRACVDDIVRRLEEKEITMVDLVSYFDDRYNSKTAPYRPNRYDAEIYFIEYIGDTIEDIFTQADKEHKEQLLFEKEDTHITE